METLISSVLQAVKHSYKEFSLVIDEAIMAHALLKQAKRNMFSSK